ncbi:MAG: methyl-accepting chemotaxis protein [Candidatus Kapabacteria bacterium]|nr:methyl-accepting chemotaxis protein [Ignavibacteriota bacterium]MCW5886021.1 methyl-accepting chemotaxis protein [Candidatus Kapabacteria bacterium]
MFKNLRISVKLLLSTFVFIIPIGVLLYYVLNSFDEHIRKAESEINGNKSLRHLVSMTNDMIEFQNILLLKESDSELFNQKFGEPYQKDLEVGLKSLSEEFVSSSSIYSDKIHQVLKSKKKHVDNLIRVDDLDKLVNKILTFEISPNSEEFDEFFSASNALVKFIADESGLILDPDLDSYYLMDISVLVLSKLQLQIGEILKTIQMSYISGLISEYHSNKIRIINDIIVYDYLARIEQGLETSLLEDARFYGESNSLQNNLGFQFETYKSDILNFSNKVDKWYTGDSDDELELLSEIKISGYNALNSNNIFWKSVSRELDILLLKRIQHYKSLRNLSLLISGLAFVFAFLSVLYVSKQISRHLGIVTGIAVEIAEGNIDKAVNDISSNDNLGVFRHYTDDKIKVRDEILILFRAIRKMTFNLSSLLTQVSKSGNLVSDTTFKITSSAHDIEATVAEQAALTNQVNATSNEISKTSSELAKTMDYLTQTFHDNANMLINGLDNLNEIKVTINELFESSGEISGKLELIQERAGTINNVITTITKVANQTNLVSLNASIEAERAGQYGTGFAVVAREIRRLADQTAVAALNIEDMITEMQVAVTEGSNTISNYMEKTKNSTEKTTIIIDRISQLIDRTNELPEKIFTANMGMKQQSESAVQINESMNQLHTAAIQSRNSIIQFNSATDLLNVAVKDLTNELKKFSLKSIS